MRRSRAILALVLATVVLAAVAAPASARWGHGMRGGDPGRGMALRPQFTQEQEQAIQKIRDKYEDQRVGLHNKLGVAADELGKLLEADAPDLGKVESKIEEMANLRLEVVKQRLRQHGEIRGLLDADQRLLFDRGLGRIFGGSMFGGQMRGMGPNSGGCGGGPDARPGMFGQCCPMGAAPGMPGAGPGAGMLRSGCPMGGPSGTAPAPDKPGAAAGTSMSPQGCPMMGVCGSRCL